MVLVCDDKKVNRDVLSNLLSSLGVSTLEAENGRQAVEMTREHQPDIVFMDIRMPVMDGLQASRQIWEEFEPDALKIVAISASTLAHQREEYLQAGFDDFISKPFRFERVCECLATLLSVEFETGEAAEADATAEQPAEIGDATGHGVGTSLMVSATKMALRLVDEPCLQRKIAEINMHLKQINNYHRLNMALTLVELSHDETSGTVRVKAAGGGMPPLIILRSNGDVKEIMIEGLPLGAMEGEKYGLTEFRLEKSDVLILMSDGLPERLNDKDEMCGDRRLAAAIQSARRMAHNALDIVDALVKFGDDWSNRTPQNDDVTLVVLKVK